MPMPVIRITKRKDGQEVPWFRGERGRIRTRLDATWGAYGVDWTQAEQVRELAEFGIQLQIAQARGGIGSDGIPMPPLKQPGRRFRWSVSRRHKVEYGAAVTGYPAFKERLGLKPFRDLWGPGGKVVTYSKTTGRKRYLRSARHVQGRGHMLDDIRINYLDDRRATFAITGQASRVKARANEERAPWWGWTTDSVAKMTQQAAAIFQTGTAEALFGMGLVGASALSEAKRMWRKVA